MFGATISLMTTLRDGSHLCFLLSPLRYSMPVVHGWTPTTLHQRKTLLSSPINIAMRKPAATVSISTSRYMSWSSSSSSSSSSSWRPSSSSFLTPDERDSIQSLLDLALTLRYDFGTSAGDSVDSNLIIDHSIFRQAVLEKMSQMPQALLVKLRQYPPYDSDMNSGNKDPEAIALSRISSAIQTILNDEFVAARDTLAMLLQAGEIRKLDSAIGQAAQDGKLHAAFFQVLTMNLQDAAREQEEGKGAGAGVGVGVGRGSSNSMSPDRSSPYTKGQSASRLQILQHIYTRCQEEVEKSLPPATALLNKLLRTEQANIRANLYRHYLTTNINANSGERSITTPDGRMIPLKNRIPPKPLIDMNDFVGAMGNTVNQIRSAASAGAMDPMTASQMVENCRQVASEARSALVAITSNDNMNAIDPWTKQQLLILEDGLQPVFRPVSDSPPPPPNEYNMRGPPSERGGGGDGRGVEK
jgi:hypothetical protein